LTLDFFFIKDEVVQNMQPVQIHDNTTYEDTIFFNIINAPLLKQELMTCKHIDCLISTFAKFASICSLGLTHIGDDTTVVLTSFRNLFTFFHHLSEMIIKERTV